MQKIVIKKLRDAASEGPAGGCEIKGAVVGLKKSCAESTYRSGTKQESGSQNLTFRLDLINHSTLTLVPRFRLEYKPSRTTWLTSKFKRPLCERT